MRFCPLSATTAFPFPPLLELLANMMEAWLPSALANISLFSPINALGMQK